MIVGGPQYRVGSHRHFVEVARGLAAAGHPVLRFDVRGMGDSTGDLHDFEQITADIGAAIDTLFEVQPTVKQIVLWGLCDAASAALLYLDDRSDARVVGLYLLNPWVRSAEGLARTHLRHYYIERITQRAFWNKLVQGGVGLRALHDLWRNLVKARAGSQGAAKVIAVPSIADRRVPFQNRMALAWRHFPGSIHVVLSEHDLTAKEFVDRSTHDKQWAAARSRQRENWIEVSGADHTFSESSAREAVLRTTIAAVCGQKQLHHPRFGKSESAPPRAS
jgi:exosortase A-associated hydrolase 1